MRIVLVTLASFSLGTFRMCGSDDPPPPPLTATASMSATAPSGAARVEVEASHGGTMVAAGQYPVEVVPHASGQVYAYAPAGIDRPANAEMTVSVPVQGGPARPVQMRWDRRERRYEGAVRGAVIVPGPIEVDLVVGEEHVHGEVAVIAVAPAIHVDVHVGDMHHHDVVVVTHHKHHKHHKHGHGHGHGHGHWGW